MLSQAKSAAQQTVENMDTPASPSTLRRRLHQLQFVVPIGLLVFVALYELGPAQWIHAAAGETYDFLVEIAVFGLIGPVLVYVSLHFIDRWLEERETTETQSRLLAQIEARANASYQLNDDALQTLFAASLMLTSLKSHATNLSPAALADLQATERAIDRAIQQIREHLLAHPPA
jgi:signal transduction histidine kinase